MSALAGFDVSQPRPGRQPREPGADSGEDTDDSAIGEVEAAIRRQRKQVRVCETRVVGSTDAMRGSMRARYPRLVIANATIMSCCGRTG
jgi:hypothetical protein